VQALNDSVRLRARRLGPGLIDISHRDVTNSHYVAGSRLSAWRVRVYRGSRPMNQSVTYRQNTAECYEAARILLTPVRRPNCLQWRSHGFRWPILPSETAILIASTKPHHGARVLSIRGTGVCHYPAPLLLHASCREGEGSPQALTTVDRPILEPMNENRSAKGAGAMEHDDFRFRRYY